MGFYVSPQNETNEQWLEVNADLTPVEDVLGAVDFKAVLPVCLVDAGTHKAAGIGIDRLEYDRMAFDCGREKKWYVVEKAKLEAVMKPEDLDKLKQYGVW